MGDMEGLCQSVITTSRGKIESIKGMIQEAAMIIPEEDGKVDPKQLAKLYAYHKTVQKMEAQARPRLDYVNLNIKFPDRCGKKRHFGNCPNFHNFINKKKIFLKIVFIKR